MKTGSPESIEGWLIANARNMDEGMFLDPRNTWECEPYQILLLRAYAPEDVFTDEAGEGFLNQVSGRQDMIDLEDALFGDDDDLINCLPSRLAFLEDMLNEAKEKAYRAGIRDE